MPFALGVQQQRTAGKIVFNSATRDRFGIIVQFFGTKF